MMETTVSGRKTILIVEEDAVIGVAGKRVLQKHGFQVLLASSGIKAIEAAKKTERIDLILMDINLGRGMDGIEAAEIILREHDIPVVFLSNSTQPEAVEKTDRIISYGYVVKDSPEAVLIASISMAFRLHEAYRQVKEKERMLSMGEERSRKAQEIARVGNWELDLRTNKIWASEEAFRIYGIEQASELPLALVQQSVLPPYRSGMDRALDRLVRQGREYDEKYQIKRLNDGLLRFIHSRAEVILAEDGTPTRVAGVIQDVTEHEISEEALRASRLQLSEAMDLAHIVCWEVDPVTNTFVLNDPFFAFYGTTAEREGGYRMTRGDYAQRFIHPDDLPLYYQFVEQSTLKPGPESVSDIEHRIIRRDGQVRHILARVRVLKDDSGRIVKRYGANQDITERKQAEEALRDSEATLRSLINATRESLLLIEPEGKILVANETIAQRLGWSVEELIGTSIYEHFPPEIAARRKEENDEVIRTGQPVHFFDERAGRTYESYGYPVFDHEGLAAKAAIFAVDITERKRSEEEIRRHVEELGTLNFIGRQVGASLSFEENAQAALKGIVRTIKPDMAFLFMREGEKLILSTVQPENAFQYVDAVSHVVGECICGMAVRDNHPLYSRDIHTDPRCTSKERKMAGMKSFAAIPLRSAGDIFGLICLASIVERDFEKQAEFLETMAGSVSASLMNSRLFEAIQLHVINLEKNITERKQAEEALKKSEALLRSIVSASPVGIVLETTGRAIIWVNDAMARNSGYSSKELEGRSARIFYASDEEFARVGEIVHNEAGHGGISVTESKFLGKDGQTRDVQLTTAPVDARDASAGIVFVVADITERKRAEEELQKAHRRLSDIIDFLPDATFVIDREKRVVAWNKAIEEMTGLKKEEILGKGDYAYAVPFYGKPRPVVIDLVFERNEEMEKTYDHVQGLGSRLSVEVYVPKIYRGRGAYLAATASPLFDHEGNVVGAIETIRDTTEQKRIEKALQESEERYRVAIEHSNDGVALVRGDRHIYVNRKFLEIFGYRSLEEVVGKSHYLTVHPDDRQKVVSYNHRRQRGEAAPNRYEFKGLRKNGEIVYIEASVTSTTYQGEPISLAFLRDVTGRRSLEAQLLQAQKIEAIGTLAGGVAHDFNNILMVLMGYANLLQMKMGQNDPSRVYVDQILASTAKAANITQSLLAFGRKQVMEMKPHKITTIVKDVEKLLRRLMPEDIGLTIKLGDDATIMADMTQIDQVLINLATNARDAMPNGGRVVIETGRVVIDEEFRRTYGYGKPGFYALLSVNDTGIGMDGKTKERIFEPFFTTKEVGKGTGLGLSIVYGIVKQHNGYINVSSRPGGGSTFLLYLPEVKEKPRETRSAVREAKGGSEILLLAEDNADIRAVMSDILKMSGYTVIEAADGRDAVEKFSEHQSEIKLIILDVVMPEKNGKEAYEEIRTMRHDVKALFMSGYTADVVLDKGVFGKTLDYIAKPIAPNELLHKVRNILDR